MLIGRKQAKYYCVFSPIKPSWDGILAHIRLPINWKPALSGTSACITEETIEDLADIIISKFPSILAMILLATCDGEIDEFVMAALKLVYGPLPFDVVRKD